MNAPAPFTTNGAYILGQTPGEHAVAAAADAADAALALARQASLTLRIFTRDLDRRLYSTAEFREALSRFARRGRRTEVRILVQDPTPAIRADHRLIGLAQQLPTHIGVRRVGRDWQDEVSAFLLADEQGLLWRPYGDRFEGTVRFLAGPRGRELRKWFDEVWEQSTPDPEFRRLGI